MIDNAALRLAEPIVPQIINRLRQAIIELRRTRPAAFRKGDRAALWREPPAGARGLHQARGGGARAGFPSRGTYVTKISVKEVLNARFVREAIECAVVREAAGRIDAAGLDRLREFIAAQERAAASFDTWPSLNWMRPSIGLSPTVSIAITRCAWSKLRAPRQIACAISACPRLALPVLIQQHRDIVGALEKRDAQAGEEAMRRHVREILSALPRLAAAHPAFFEDQASLAGL